jgi:hypothetical protein
MASVCPPGTLERLHEEVRVFSGVRSLVPALLVLAVACHGQHPQSGVPPVELPAVRVAVTNHYVLPMEIEVSGGGSSYRLGLVDPGMVRNFTIPKGVVTSSTLELWAHPTERGELYRSGSLLIAPGDIVDVELKTPLFGSTAVIRP